MKEKIILFRQHFFKYINRAEYALAISSIFGTIATTIIQGYSSYLSDRNNRIERINKNPLKRIYVDYVSFNEYQKMIDPKNWKSISEKIAKQQKDNINIQQQNTFEYKKNEAIKSINSWLLNKTKKNTMNNSEIDEDSLKKLAEINNRSYISNNDLVNSKDNIVNKNNNDKNDDNLIDVNNMNSSVSKISEITGKTKKNVLPPGFKKKEQIKYFVVQDAGGYYRYNPITYRKNHMKQNIQLKTKDRKSVGKIGNQDIVKDDSIFKSLYNIWAFFLYKKDPKRNVQVIHSGYDQYGNKIKNYNYSGGNNVSIKTKKEIVKTNKNNKIYDKKVNNNLQADNEISNNDIIDEEINFIVPKFIIDKNIEKNDIYNNLIINDNNKNITSIDLDMLMYLEYTIENCWYQNYTKKGGKNIASRFTIEYNNNGKLKDIKMNYFNKEIINKDIKNQFIQNVIKVIYACDITNIKNLNKNNYNIWGKIKIEFK